MTSPETFKLESEDDMIRTDHSEIITCPYENSDHEEKNHKNGHESEQNAAAEKCIRPACYSQHSTGRSTISGEILLLDENQDLLKDKVKSEAADFDDLEEHLDKFEQLLALDPSAGMEMEHVSDEIKEELDPSDFIEESNECREKIRSDLDVDYQVPTCTKSVLIEDEIMKTFEKNFDNVSSADSNCSEGMEFTELDEILNPDKPDECEKLARSCPIKENRKRKKQDRQFPTCSGTLRRDGQPKEKQLRKSTKSGNFSDSDVAEELQLSELEELLDADLPNEYKKPIPSSFIQQFSERRKQDGDIVEIEKTIFQDINADNFDLLPEGWLQVTHNIGIPVYLDRRHRVCTLARPYFLGSGNVYNHKIPLSAIPCLQYRQVLEKKSDPIAQAKVSQATVDDCMRLIGNIRVPIVKIETVCDNQRSQSLDAAQVREYCQKLFKYKNGFVKRDKNIKNRQHTKVSENHNFKNRPSLPPGTKLLSFMVFDRDPNGEIIRRRECVMNPSGRSYIAILHEYLQQSLRIQPVYQYKEKDNEYEAVVKLKDTVYGRGVSVGKKEAKLLAAKAAVEKLIPELNGKAEEIISVNLKEAGNTESAADSNNIFDEITITDPRVQDFCSRTTEPSPYAMLQTCLRRNCGTVDIDTDYTVSAKHNKYNQFTMTVGKHTVSVSCRNKREGKQKAAQQILQGLHPQLKTWGSLVRLYGNRSVKNAKEKKLEEQEITQLQTLAKINSPNHAILNKLKAELEKLYQKKERMKPIGKLVMNDVPTNSGANLNPLNYS